jgi:uncharacterized protein
MTNMTLNGSSTISDPDRRPPVARLLESAHGWWVVNGTRVALLPREAAPDGHLVDEATRTLSERGFFATAPRGAYAVTVLTATSCNLGCPYCFQNTDAPAEGSFAPPRIPTAVLTPAHVEKVVAFIQQQMAILGFDEVSLLLFGGEPLLNLPACRQLLRQLRPIGLTSAEMITNAVLLGPRVAAQLFDAGLQRVQITFDGGRDAHDAVRATRAGRGTFDTIIANVRAAAATTRLWFHFRVNVSHLNIGDLGQLVAELTDAVPPGRGSIHLALIDDVGIGYTNDVGYSDACADSFISAYRQAIAGGLLPPLSQDLRDCVYCGESGGATGAVINADGKLYSCWETAGRDDWGVGHVETGYLCPEQMAPRWVACDYDIKSHGLPVEVRRFYDRVDGAILDQMRDQLRAGVPLPVVASG